MMQKRFDSTKFHKQHHKQAAKLHRNTNDWHKKHNERVADFHKSHVAKLERGENGSGLLAKWERFIYNKGKALFKAAK